MAHWDKEMFAVETPPASQCKTCKFALEKITVGDFTQERYAYGMCGKYQTKPNDILWDKKTCPVYEEKDGRKN